MTYSDHLRVTQAGLQAAHGTRALKGSFPALLISLRPRKPGVVGLIHQYLFREAGYMVIARLLQFRKGLHFWVQSDVLGHN